MNACPNDDELLRFLDGELDAEADAWVVAHVENCGVCQAGLERLTRGVRSAGDGSPIETVGTDRAPSADLPPTEDIDHDEPDREGPEADSTQELGSASSAGQAWDTREASGDREAAADDADRTASVDAIERERHSSGRRPAPADWPAVAGYDVLQRLGEGGMGVVYKARHRALNRLVALKMIRGGTQARADHLSRFRVEAEAVAQLRHPNILQIYDIGEAGGLPFVALELLDGGGLDDRLAGNPQPGRQAAELMITLARAVQVAHQAGIIHRDLKPTNVLYTGDGVPKITDFGLAKRIDSDGGQTQSGQIMGSPSYMAPEQARGHSRKVGPAADVYALGSILYEMLTGRPPFKGETPMETVRQVLDDDPVTPSRLVPRVPRDLETICLKCLHKDPSRRYDSAQALAEDLERYLRGEPVQARRTPIWERGAKWARRRPWAAAASIVLGVLVLGGAIGGFAWERAGRIAAEHQARRNQDRQDVGNDLIDRARGAASRAALDEMTIALSKFSVEIREAPGLAGLRSRVHDSLKMVETRIDELQAREARRSQEREDRDRFQKFRALLTDAFFHDTEFTGLDLPTNREVTRRAVQAALDLYSAPGSGDAWALGPLPESLSQPEQAEVTEGCYELLLILADVEPIPERGLLRLDQAARLRSPTRAYHLRRADCLARLGNAAAADRERRGAEAVNPTTAPECFVAGHERFKRRNPMAAIRHFNDALRLQPDHFWSQCLSAICWLQLGRTAEAGAGLNACLKRDPEFAWLYILRGFAASRIPVNAGPEEVAVRYAAAEADYRRAMEQLQRKPNDELRYVLLVNRGLLRYQRGALEEAMSELTAAIRQNDRHAHAYAELAMVYRKQGKLNEAVEQFSRAIERRPDHAPLYRNRAEVTLARKASTPAQRAEALRDLDQAIRLESAGNPVLALDHTDRGRLLALDHREPEALAACDAAIQVVGDYDDAHRLRIELLLRLQRHDDVIRSCNALIARGKASSGLYELRSLAREEIKDIPGAIEDLTNAMAARADRAPLLRRRGWLYIVSDAPQLALHDFEAAIRLDPAQGDGYTGRGFARLRLGEHREGVADAEKALSLGEPTSRLLYNAARVYAVAAVAAAAEVRKKGPETVTLVARYQDRAVVLLRQALKRLPDDQRASFWRDSIQADPALRALRRRIASPDLAG